MEYENVDESAVYLEACRKVKQIAEAIKNIKIKYYPNFAKISVEDKEVYDELNSQIDKVAEEHGLNKLKVELMSDIEDRYDGNMPESSENGQQNEGGSNSEKLLKAYCGAKEIEQKFLKIGRIGKALECQQQADKIWELLSEEEKQEATNYKRELFATLSVPISEANKKKEEWMSTLNGFYTKSNAQSRNEATGEISDLQNEKTQEEMVIE